MISNNELEIELLLDDINKVINANLKYFEDPHYIWNQKELVLALLSVDEKIQAIKYLLKEKN